MDVISCSEEIAAVAEFYGVNKKDIRLKADDKSLTLELFAGERQFQKRFDLPEEFEPNSDQSTYKNGILEVSFKLKKE